MRWALLVLAFCSNDGAYREGKAVCRYGYDRPESLRYFVAGSYRLIS